MEAWARAGVGLLHWTGYQWVSGPNVPLAGLRRGDLVFYTFPGLIGVTAPPPETASRSRVGYTVFSKCLSANGGWLAVLRVT
jgi:cell wall-associated NlpC family hydrolase